MIASACLQQAAAAYAVPVPAIESVITSAQGAGGIGPMGIPAAWLPVLSRIGFSSDQVQSDPCINIAAGAWIMAYEKLATKGGQPAQSAPAGPPLPAGPNAGGVSDACVVTAAKKFGLQVVLLRGILATEGGHVGQIHSNNNGTFDMGPAQVNSTWLPKLETMGITKSALINDGCLNVSVGAWILAQAMQGADPQQPAQFWQHVGAYNSQTPYYNQKYAATVWSHVTQLAELDNK
jgi:soluble lytic murein transglycosylase-like protein